MHATASSHAGRVPASHLPVPRLQVSGPLQKTWSSQSPSAAHSAVATQPWTGEQRSPAAQAQASPTWAQRCMSSSQKSAVHATPSSQTGGVPCWQRPATQVSVPLQKKPSSQSAGTAHSMAGPQPVAKQAWSMPQAEPSGTCTQAWRPSSQRSTVQATSSSQAGAAPRTQRSAATSQVSGPLQYTPSSQSASTVQRGALGAVSVVFVVQAANTTSVTNAAARRIGTPLARDRRAGDTRRADAIRRDLARPAIAARGSPPPLHYT